jgi:hypothetical protein
MVKVKIFFERQKIIGFDICGHTDFAPKGEDIVCAGISSLSQAALLGLVEHLHRQVGYETASGKLTVRLSDEPDERTEAIFRTMLLGLEAISEKYPGYSRLRYVEVDKR